jgi:hypothetical protein
MNAAGKELGEAAGEDAEASLSGRMSARRSPSGIRNSPPPIRKRSG